MDEKLGAELLDCLRRTVDALEAIYVGGPNGIFTEAEVKARCEAARDLITEAEKTGGEPCNES